jgi:hypothetical protein
MAIGGRAYLFFWSPLTAAARRSLLYLLGKVDEMCYTGRVREATSGFAALEVEYAIENKSLHNTCLGHFPHDFTKREKLGVWGGSAVRPDSP